MCLEPYMQIVKNAGILILIRQSNKPVALKMRTCKNQGLVWFACNSIAVLIKIIKYYIYFFILIKKGYEAAPVCWSRSVGFSGSLVVSSPGAHALRFSHGGYGVQCYPRKKGIQPVSRGSSRYDTKNTVLKKQFVDQRKCVPCRDRPTNTK